MTKKTFIRQQGQTKENDPQYWFNRFQQELYSQVHLKISLSSCFKASICNQVVPDHFPYVFWKGPFVYHRERWKIADHIVPNLYHICMEHPSAVSFRGDIPLTEVMINYAFWRGSFSWIYSLSSLCYQRNYFHSELFQVAALCLAYHENFDTANFYYQQASKGVDPLSPYFQYSFQTLMGDHAKDDKDKITKRKTTSISQELRLRWIVSCCDGDISQEKKLIHKMTMINVDEDTLLDQYACLIARGLLYNANRMVLRYVAKKEECGYLLMLVLQSYLQNQKHYAYLLRLSIHKFWLGNICWYEAEYCISRLGLSSERSQTWFHILSNKSKKVVLPTAKEQRNFHSFLRATKKQLHELSHFVPDACVDLLLDHHLSMASDEAHLLQRRFNFYRSFILEPLNLSQDLKPSTITICSGALFWTFYLYLDTLRFSPFIKLLKSLSGQILSSRLLLATHYFRYGSKEKSRKLLSSAAHHHPLFQTFGVNIAVDSDEFSQADKISSRLVKKFPQDFTLHKNHALIHQKSQDHNRDTG